MQFRLWNCCIISCLFFSAIEASAAQTIVFSDGVFANGVWVAGPKGGSSSTTVTTNQQVLTGGNPDQYWRFSFSASDNSTSTFLQTYFNSSASFNPATLGAITSLSGGFQQDLLSYSGISDVFDTYLAIRQNNTVYLPTNAYGLQHVSPGWYGNDHLYSTGSISTPSGWTRYSGSGPNTPVFLSAGGSNIEFGIAVGSYFNNGSGQITGGIDNWTTSIGYTPLPEPSSWSALLALAALSFRGSRRRVESHA